MDYHEGMDPRIARLLDASANRAREGLRVMEDHARFVLNRADLSERLKQTRHAVTRIANSLGAGALLAARDVAGDVGVGVRAPAEQSRADPEGVVRAAAGRCTEALRSLEEFAKCIDVAAAEDFAAMRYEVYAVEQALLVGAARRLRIRAARVQVLLTGSLCRGDWRTVARQVLQAGADVLQLREKSMPDRELLDRARWLRGLTRDQGSLLIVNDRPDLARLADADGVHVGQADLPVAEARSIVGADRLVGVSTHDAEQFEAALAAQPDYIAVGPMYESSTKPGATPAGIALLQRVSGRAAAVGMPLAAIGGVSSARAAEVARAGGRCVAVCADVIGSPDPAAAIRALRAALEPECTASAV